MMNVYGALEQFANDDISQIHDLAVTPGKREIKISAAMQGAAK
jgi:hypothetical protein